MEGSGIVWNPAVYTVYTVYTVYSYCRANNVALGPSALKHYVIKIIKAWRHRYSRLVDYSRLFGIRLVD